MDQNKQIQIERLGKKRHFIAFKNVKNLFVTVLIKSDVYLPNCLLNNHFSISIRMFLVSYTCFSHVALNQNCNEQNFHITNFHVDFRFSDSSFEATMDDVIGMTHRKMILDHDIWNQLFHFIIEEKVIGNNGSFLWPFLKNYDFGSKFHYAYAILKTVRWFWDAF